LAFVSIEKTPVVTDTKVANTDDAVRAKKLIKESLKSLLDSQNNTIIFTTEEDLQALMAFAARGIKELSGRVDIMPGMLVTSATFQLPNNPIGKYINMKIFLDSSQSGLKISEVKWGRVHLPGDLVVNIIQFLLDLILGDEQGTLLFESVESVVIGKNSIIVYRRPVPSLRGRLRKVEARLKNLRDEIAPLGDPLIVRIYYAKLMELSERSFESPSLSLAHFTGPLFSLAKERSATSNPADENQAAILALAMYFGHWRFGSLIGPVLSDEMNRNRRQMNDVVLGGRKDLRLHFIYSAGIKILSDRGIAYAIGEFKELLDAAKGGTGFSFADLAADLTGVHFAEVATDSSGGSRRLQSLLAGNVIEEVFFPDVTDLPENISKVEFERLYEDVESEAYRKMISLIERTIKRLPAYNNSIETKNIK